MGSRILTNSPVYLVSDAITRPGDTTAYASGDAISEVTTTDFFTFTLPDALRGARSGRILGAVLTSSAYVAGGLACELWLAWKLFTETADNAAWALSDADLAYFQGRLDFAAASWSPGNATAGAGGNALVTLSGISVPFIIADPSAPKLYAQLIARGAYTPVASEVFTAQLLIQAD